MVFSVDKWIYPQGRPTGDQIRKEKRPGECRGVFVCPGCMACVLAQVGPKTGVRFWACALALARFEVFLFVFRDLGWVFIKHTLTGRQRIPQRLFARADIVLFADGFEQDVAVAV